MTQGSAPRPVVVGVDGSQAALAAARFALDEARRPSAPLHIVTAVPWPYDGLTATPPRDDLPALLLVVGHRARRAPGSTTHGVLNRASSPVAVVPVATGGGQ